MLRQVTVATSLTLLAAGCALWRGLHGHDEAARPARPDSVLIAALNENYYDARIHAVWVGGQRRSLGTIAGNGGRARIAIAWEPRELSFEVLLVTLGAAYVSLPVDVAPEDSIDFRVPSNISESGFFRRVRADVNR